MHDLLDKRVRIVAGKGMSRKCKEQVKLLKHVYGTIIGSFVTKDIYRVELEKGIVLDGSKPLTRDQHEILVPLANLRLVE